jgi:uncharacterized protein (DUF58 family)
MGAKLDFSAIAIIFLAVAVIVLAVLNLTAPPAAGFTELYFTGELPKTAHVGEEQSFTFALHNLENQDMLYTYGIFLGPVLLKQDSVSLRQGFTASVSERFTIDEIPENSTIPVSVRLIGKAQEIDFWVMVE